MKTEILTYQKIRTLVHQKQLLEQYPLLQIVADQRFDVNMKMLFKAEVIAHGGFVYGDRKDVKVCARYIQSENNIY